MANYSKFIKLLLSFVIAISPIVLINNANAANIGGWTMSNPIANGASTVYNGTKQVIIDGKDYIKKGTAIVTPTATGVAKVLAKGVAGVALSVAVEQLIGAVDWVLDPANNRIKWSEKTEVLVGSAYWITQINEAKSTISLLDSCTKFMLHNAKYISYGSGISYTNPKAYYYHVTSDQKLFYCEYDIFQDGTYLSTSKVQGQLIGESTIEEIEEKSIPLDVVAQKVISNAESGDTNAQVATGAAAADVVAEAETDQTGVKARPIVNQLENSASTKPADEAAADKANEATGEQTKNPDKPDTTDLKLEFPAFCGWAPVVCEAAQVVISFPQTLTNWWETANTKADGWATSISESWAAAKEWATSEPSQDNTQVDVENNNTQEIDTQVLFSTQCPAPINLANFSYHGISQSWTVDFSKFCDVFATYLKPVVISIGAFSAVLIVSGVGVRENG